MSGIGHGSLPSTTSTSSAVTRSTLVPPQGSGSRVLWRRLVGSRVAGHDWVVAPVPSRRGAEVLQDFDDRFVCVIYPVVDERSNSSGEYDDADERRSVVSLLVDPDRADPSGSARPFPAIM